MEFDLTKKHCYYFNEISKIPHGSRNEKAISDYIVEFAKEHNLPYKQDHVWNVYIEKPATAGYEDVAPVILQGHIDMVNEKNKDSDHDFSKDPLDLYVDEEGWLHAKGTTLGCDDGYGVAYMLSILDDNTLEHPALQCWFTAMEEVGLLGAMEIKAEDVHAHRMINLDGGGETVTAISSAGALSIMIDKNLELEDSTTPTYAIRVRGLLGGHSGGSIHEERGNSILLAASIAKEATMEGADIQLVSFDGGMKFNAIPREADVVFTSAIDEEKLREYFEKKENEIKEQLEFSDAGFRLEFERVEMASKRMTKKCSDELLSFLYLIPNGFQHKSMAIEGLTLASSNLGVVTTESDKFHGEVLARSAISSYNESNGMRMIALGKLTNTDVRITDRIPSWNYNPNSELRELYREILKKDGKELETVATHGGLETGVFKGLVPDMDIICEGPVATGAHTPDEKLNLESFDRAYGYLCEILKNLH